MKDRYRTHELSEGDLLFGDLYVLSARKGSVVLLGRERDADGIAEQTIEEFREGCDRIRAKRAARRRNDLTRTDRRR